MSAPDLPDDLDLWPSNPYELLGVSHGVTFNELRKAYTRLIRRFKPEQKPDHFRRVRAAFDLLSQYVERPSSKSEEEAPPPVEESPVRSSAPILEEAITTAPRSIAASTEDDVEELWRLACSSQEDEAYRRLASLNERRPGQVEVLLQLYWLLVLFPQQDARRSPLDWLVTGLTRLGMVGPLKELYRRETVLRPDEALSDRYERLLALSQGPKQLAELLEWRWLAASRLQRPGVIAGDLQGYRDRVQNEDDEAWLRLLVTAAEQLIAIHTVPTAQPLIAQCSKEAERLDHLATRFPELYDRLEIITGSLAGLSYLWQEEGTNSLLWRLLSSSWGRPFSELRPFLEEYLAQVADKPRKAMVTLLQTGTKSLALLSRITHLLRWYQDAIGASYMPEHGEVLESELAQKILVRSAGLEYYQIRLLLLDFFLSDGLLPERVAQHASQAVAEKIHNDLPLHSICWGYRLFRG
jgi:hypothetical protein